jgi:alkylhydroperoxidase family enzyme
VHTSSRHSDKVQTFRRAVETSEGELAPSLRRRIVAGEAVEGPLGQLVERVRHEAHAITDAEVEALLEAGLSEDQIFEATVAAALGEGLARLEPALRALEQA